VRLLRRYGIWVVFATIACVAGAWLGGGHRPVQYTSAADVDVEASAIPNTVPAVVNMDTEKEVASSGVVVALAAPLAGMTPGQLAARLSISVPSGANAMSISCTMPTAVSAQRCAQAATQAYMNFRNDAAAKKAAKKAAHAPDPLNVTLITPAQVPAAPSGLHLKVLLSLGAFVGLVAGVGTALIRDRLDDRVRDRDDLESCLDAAVLAAVPRVRRSARPASVFSTAPNSAAAEAYRYLRAHLEPLISPAGGGKVVLVTSAQPRDGRTCLASNLAAALAQAGTRVLLVDADLRHPSLAEIFRTGPQAGLTDLLAGHAALDDVIVRTDLPGLRLVTIGGNADRPADLFDAGRLARVVSRMRAAADIVVIDSGPVLSVPGPITLAPLSDLVVVVANVRCSRRESIRAAAQELRTAGPVTILGVLAGLPRPLAKPVPRSSRAARPETAFPDAPPRAGAQPDAPAKLAVISGQRARPGTRGEPDISAAGDNYADHRAAAAHPPANRANSRSASPDEDHL
jgi:succinoglycan biosynthesis transport protein ExoP